jgi:hypothetical protein
MDDKKKNKNHQPSSRKNGSASSTTASPRSQKPTVPHQKQDVLLLLLAHQQPLQSTTKAGEAFFLLDWNWWCQRCRHVDFFYTSEKEAIAMATASTTIESQKESERIQQVLELLPRGPPCPHETKKITRMTIPVRIVRRILVRNGHHKDLQERLTRIASTAARQ